MCVETSNESNGCSFRAPLFGLACGHTVHWGSTIRHRGLHTPSHVMLWRLHHRGARRSLVSIRLTRT